MTDKRVVLEMSADDYERLASFVRVALCAGDKLAVSYVRGEVRPTAEYEWLIKACGERIALGQIEQIEGYRDPRAVLNGASKAGEGLSSALAELRANHESLELAWRLIEEHLPIAPPGGTHGGHK